MCGRYFIAEKNTPQALKAILDTLNRRGTPAKTGEIFPSDIVPVIANSKRLIPSPFAMRWGYEQSGKRIINARSETAAQKPLFADSMRFRRCLIPASGYYEWARRSREKTKYEIADDQSSLLFFAGLYRLTDSGAEFVILTEEPQERIAFIHDRMPVVLPHSLLAEWLNPHTDPNALLCCTKPTLHANPAAGQAETLSFFDDWLIE